jgi:ATP-binding cassette subfamily B protein
VSAATSGRKHLYWRLWEEARPYSWHLAGLFGFSLLGTPVALLTPVPLQIAVDNIIGARPLPGLLAAWLPDSVQRSDAALLGFAVALMMAVALLGQLREFGSGLLTAYTSEALLRGFRAKLFRHVQRLSLSYHETQGSADSIYRIQNDATALQQIAVNGVVPFVTSTVTFASMVYVIARINWQLALVGLGVAPLIFIVSRTYRRRLRKQTREVKKMESAALSVVHEVLGAARVVKAFGQEDREQERFIRKSNEGMRARIRLVFAGRGYGLSVTLITATGTAAVLLIGVQAIQAHTLSLGKFLLVMGYLTQLYAPLKTIGKKMANAQNYLVSAERAFALLDVAPDVPEKPNAQGIARAAGAIAFRKVSFAYHEEQTVLSEISFEVEPGTCLGIVGTTGAGKTTLVSLLTRFYDPTAGEIRLDGRDLRDYRLCDLRNQFAIVLQEPVLFSTRIAENIAYARPGASEAEIVAAARAANAHDFIARLPQGYQTLVGERGMKLSGGERQRISLARAFLKDAPILILDEPTSSVDVKTEGIIVEAMERLMRGRTTFIIAHRISTLQHCDRLLRIEHGRVASFETVASPDRAGTPSLEPEPAAA